jgi:hypothetical protein
MFYLNVIATPIRARLGMLDTGYRNADPAEAFLIAFLIAHKHTHTHANTHTHTRTHTHTQRPKKFQ